MPFGLTESRKTNTDSVMMTAFCLTKDDFFFQDFTLKSTMGISLSK